MIDPLDIIEFVAWLLEAGYAEIVPSEDIPGTVEVRISEKGHEMVRRKRKFMEAGGN